MFIKMFIKILMNILLVVISSCHSKNEQGYVIIKSQGEEIPLEIYQIKQENPLQLTSEVIIHSNKKVAFTPGTYLVLADCSHEQIIVRPNEITEVNLTNMTFVPPLEPTPGDYFSIQCNRHDTGLFRQTIVDRFRLNVLGNAKSALISMSPTLLPKADPNSNTEIPLSAVRVKSKPEKDSIYFVSSTDEKQAVTKGVKFGAWQYLMPGAYDISVNGTTQSIKLAAGEMLTLETGYLEILAPEEIEIERIAKVRGYPFQIRLGHDHFLALNEKYPMLSGPIQIHFDSSNIITHEEIKVNEVKTLRLRSVEIDFGCEKVDPKCSGRGEIMLYMGNEHFPFLESVSDIPVLFYGDHVKVGISGSRDIRYGLAPGQKSTYLKTGKVTLKPNIINKSQSVTDLVRFEAAGSPSVGFTLDILPTWKPFTMNFIAGRYRFVQSSSKYGSDGERSIKSQTYLIQPNSHIEIEFPYWVSESQYEKLLKIKPKTDNG